MTTSLPPDFQIEDTGTAAVDDPVITRQTEFTSRLSKLRERFDEMCRLHDAADNPVDKRRYLASIAAIRRQMIWYEARIPGAQNPGNAQRKKRLSDQIISLDPILSRLP